MILPSQEKYQKHKAAIPLPNLEARVDSFGYKVIHKTNIFVISTCVQYTEIRQKDKTYIVSQEVRPARDGSGSIARGLKLKRARASGPRNSLPWREITQCCRIPETAIDFDG